jgi:hypothetical protein
VDDVNEFMENLEQTGAFKNLNASTDRMNEQGQLESQLETSYTPAGAKPAGAAGAERP